MSRYTLDGIETAMERTSRSEAGTDDLHSIICPCGREFFIGRTPEYASMSVPYLADIESAKHALRFHYTHCPKARIPEENDGSR